jgi:hypothetical protein
MPFTLLAARCVYIAQQPMKYRQAVVKRIYAGKVASIATLCSFNLPEILSTVNILSLTY